MAILLFFFVSSGVHSLGVRKGSNGVSANGVTAMFMLFDTGICGVLPLTDFDVPKVPGRTFFPNLSKFAAAPLGSTQFVRSKGVVSVCFFIEGVTNAFDVIYMSMLADRTHGAARSAAFGGNHLSKTTCLTQVFFQKWRIMWQLTVILDTINKAYNKRGCIGQVASDKTSSATQGLHGLLRLRPLRAGCGAARLHPRSPDVSRELRAGLAGNKNTNNNYTNYTMTYN